MNTTHAQTTAETYLEQVRTLLSDLPEEERAELVQDLAAHLEEIDQHEIETGLGTPEEFVAEFRTMAGLGEHRTQEPGVFDRLARRVTRYRAHPTVERIRVHWQQARPVWVGIRGWLLVALPAAIYADRFAFRRFPIPQVEDSPLGGLIAVTALTALSVIAARRALAGTSMWRLANVSLNVAVIWLLAISLAGGVLYTDRGASIREEAVTQAIIEDVGMILPQDLIATTPDGDPIDAVRLYDENGEPFDVARIREALEQNWGWALERGDTIWIGPDGTIEDPDSVPTDEEINNLYPSSRR